MALIGSNFVWYHMSIKDWPQGYSRAAFFHALEVIP